MTNNIKKDHQVVSGKKHFICHPLHWYHCLYTTVNFVEGHPLYQDPELKPVWLSQLLCKCIKVVYYNRSILGAGIRKLFKPQQVIHDHSIEMGGVVGTAMQLSV